MWNSEKSTVKVAEVNAKIRPILRIVFFAQNKKMFVVFIIFTSCWVVRKFKINHLHKILISTQKIIMSPEKFVCIWQKKETKLINLIIFITFISVSERYIFANKKMIWTNLNFLMRFDYRLLRFDALRLSIAFHSAQHPAAISPSFLLVKKSEKK